MPRLALALALALAVALPGCAQLDDAQAKIDEAKREAQEAKDRYERVKSATIVRTELVDLLVQAVRAENVVTFHVTAVRDGYTIPRENLTSVQPIALLWPDSTETHCDPLSCGVDTVQAGALKWGWADQEARAPLTEPLSRSRGEARVTTAAGDVAG